MLIEQSLPFCDSSAVYFEIRPNKIEKKEVYQTKKVNFRKFYSLKGIE